MKRIKILVPLLFLIVIISSWSVSSREIRGDYTAYYFTQLKDLNAAHERLIEIVNHSDLSIPGQRENLKKEVAINRNSLKTLDFWLRYFEPIRYKKINGPLPVEWETEVFEKFEKPYRREGAGYTLAWLWLDEGHIKKEELLAILEPVGHALKIFESDSISAQLNAPDHFYFCNRLLLLNLAALYTTGFENPDPPSIIPELRILLEATARIYRNYNTAFPKNQLSHEYMELFDQTIEFVKDQPKDHEQFDHFSFIRNYVNPLFGMNQAFIRRYKPVTGSYMDYSLNNNANTIFSKTLYRGQDEKGIYRRVREPELLEEIEKLGRNLFFDPILSGNGQRSCASCHKPEQYYTDTAAATALKFDKSGSLPRNTPSLLNAPYNHLLMHDGRHTTLQAQARAVLTSESEMACPEKDILEKVLSCGQYKKTLRKLLKTTPQEKEISIEHITSALTYYYSRFSHSSSPFDAIMNSTVEANNEIVKGFNIFMGKAQCGTCHFVPQFNGVKPPYIGSEFEVLGVPADTTFSSLSLDIGRYMVNPANETLRAFRTGTIRNTARTMPYMHNGVFSSLEQVIDFYDNGGGIGKGLRLDNQTLSGDSLHLTSTEKLALIKFIRSLNENINIDHGPQTLPQSKINALNNRRPGGLY